MALIQCPECGAQVSSSAGSCPKCAYPIAGGGSTQAHGGKVQTIEQTSKPLKLQALLSALLTTVGFAVLLVALGLGPQPSGLVLALGTLSFVGGLIWFTFVRLLIWWHHG